MKIKSEIDLELAFKNKENKIHIENSTIGNSFLVAGKIQNGILPAIVLKRIPDNGTCKVSISDGVIVSVTKELSESVSVLLDYLDSNNIEIDIEDARTKQINLYYNI